jgi:hypothetical protein
MTERKDVDERILELLAEYIPLKALAKSVRQEFSSALINELVDMNANFTELDDDSDSSYSDEEENDYRRNLFDDDL